jgi:hypothetical protein
MTTKPGALDLVFGVAPATVPVAFPGAQTAGDLNMVVVGLERHDVHGEHQ